MNARIEFLLGVVIFTAMGTLDELFHRSRPY